MGKTKNFKAVFLGCLAVLIVAFLAMPQFVVAGELGPSPDHSVTLMELLAMFVGNEQAGKWLMVLGLVGYGFTQLRAWLPLHWLARLPRWLVKLMEVLAGNYRRAGNEDTNNPDSYRKAV